MNKRSDTDPDNKAVALRFSVVWWWASFLGPPYVLACLTR
jgi:hypothetical protein